MADLNNRKDETLLIQGYTVIQVKQNEQKVCHCLYLREHSSPAVTNEWPQGRTLLVHNIPSYCNEDNLRHILKDCGDIMMIYLQYEQSSKPIKKSQFPINIKEVGVQVAYVVFKKPGGLKKATSLAYDQERPLSNAETPVLSGLKKYILQYESSIIDEKELEKNAEKYMAKYNKKKDEEIEREKAMVGVPDEDGFIKVSRYGKGNQKGFKRNADTQKKAYEYIRKKKEKNELKDFYVFQYRESKRKHIAELQAKFEEDQKRVLEMKAARKFRPY